MKKHLSLLSIPLLTALTLSACQDKPMDEAKMVDAIIAQISEAKPDQPMPEGFRDQVTADIRLNRLIADAARSEKLDQDASFKAMMELQSMQLLSDRYFQKKMKDFNPSDDELKKIYDEEVARIKNLTATSTKEFNLRHILVATLEQANTIEAQLAKGTAFEELAKQSIDPGSASNGGQLGWGPLTKWVPEFAEAASKLKAGEYSKPVKTQFGYHIIQLIEAPRDIKDAKATPMPDIPPFEQVKSALLESAKNKHLEGLRAEFKAKADAMAPAKLADTKASSSGDAQSKQ